MASRPAWWFRQRFLPWQLEGCVHRIGTRTYGSLTLRLATAVRFHRESESPEACAFTGTQKPHHRVGLVFCYEAATGITGYSLKRGETEQGRQVFVNGRRREMLRRWEQRYHFVT